MRYVSLLIPLLLLAGPAHADTIWKCQDLQKVPEFSAIQCAPDAEIYVPSRPNTGGGFGGDSGDDSRYKRFIEEHNARFQAEQKANASRRNTEGRNLKRFKSYSVPAR